MQIMPCELNEFSFEPAFHLPLNAARIQDRTKHSATGNHQKEVVVSVCVCVCVQWSATGFMSVQSWVHKTSRVHTSWFVHESNPICARYTICVLVFNQLYALEPFKSEYGPVCHVEGQNL